MKKIGFILFLLLASCIFLGCSVSKNHTGFIDYTNTLVSYQQDVVGILKKYYEDIEKISNGKDLFSLYNNTLSEFNSLYYLVEKTSEWNSNSDLKNALLVYITGINLAFEKNEKPVIEMVTNFSGNSNGFYKKSQLLFPSYTMNLSSKLSELDSAFFSSYDEFVREYNY